jgi:glyoxylase-like metal-dependent hydrolase (beta-lactamase superfamily II)
VKRVAENLFLFEAAATNVYLVVGTKDLTMIDTGDAPSIEPLLSEMAENGFSWDEVGRVVLTHADPDNSGGLAPLLAKRPVRVFAHPEAVPFLTGAKPQREHGGYFKRRKNKKAFPFEPVDTVMPAEPGIPPTGFPHWQVLHTPGHTPGSLSFYDPVKQILVCGDLLSNEGGTLAFPAGDTNEDEPLLRKSVETVAKMDVDVLCPGRGPLLRGGAFRFIEKLLER